MSKKDPARVYILDVYEAGKFAGREGRTYGWSIPSSSGVTPLIGARKGRDDDFAISVYFEDSGDQEWFAPRLVEVIESGVL